jgi:hypothetical protein
VGSLRAGLNAGLRWTDAHPVRAAALVVWCACLVGGVGQKPWRVLDPESEPRHKVFGQRWAFFTATRPDQLLRVAEAPPGQSLSRRGDQLTQELYALQAGLPMQAIPSEVGLKGRPGMLLCGKHVHAERLSRNGREFVVSYRQAVTVRC